MKIEVEKVHSYKGHNDCVYSLEPSEKNSSFFSASGDGMIANWDLSNVEDGKLLAKVTSSVYALHYVSDKNQLIVGQNGEGIHFIDLDSKREVGSLKLDANSFFDIKTFQDFAFVGSNEGTVWVIDLKSFSLVHKIEHSGKSARCIAVNSSLMQIAVGYSDHSVKIFDLGDFHLIKVLNEHSNSVFTVSYSPDQKRLISGSRDAHLMVWDAENDYHLLKKIPAHMYAINHITHSPDGRYLASCSMDKSIKIWDSTSYKLLKVIDKARHAGHGTSVNKLLWSEYHDLLVSCSDDRSISVWKLQFNN